MRNPLKFRAILGPITLILFPWSSCTKGYAQALVQPGPKVDCGSSYRISAWNNPLFSDRLVDVWLPSGYPNAAPYPVVYMHDGQMLFDAEQTWNRQSWNIDSILCASQAVGKSPIPIVVGIWNNPNTRHADTYQQNRSMPFRPLNNNMLAQNFSSMVVQMGHSNQIQMRIWHF